MEQVQVRENGSIIKSANCETDMKDTPMHTMLTLVEARKNGDMETALGCYEKEASIVFGPGKVGVGQQALCNFIQFAMSLPVVFTTRNVIEGHDTALHYSAWTSSSVDDKGQAQELGGITTDVLRKQADGSWLIAIDNAWGVSVLDKAT